MGTIFLEGIKDGLSSTCVFMMCMLNSNPNMWLCMICNCAMVIGVACLRFERTYLKMP